MKNGNFWKWLSVLLLLCNTALLVLILMRPGPPPHPHGGPHKLDAFIIEELDLNAEQQTKFQALKKEHRAKIDALMDEGKKLRNAYFGELKKDAANDSIVNKNADAIAENQRQIELATFDHFHSVRQICTEAQKELFDNIIFEVLHRMAPHPPPPPPPPGDAPEAPAPPPPPPVE